jgi:hemoglobin
LSRQKIAVQPSPYTIYDQIGGEPTLRRLVDAFYTRVAADPLLRPMFSDDLDESKRRQFLFLVQFFGGPQTYSAERGHPRMKMRHSPFTIGPAERDAWLEHMLASIDEISIEEPMRTLMRDYFTRTAEHMVNR